MKDFLGQELAVGDTIIYTTGEYNELYKAVITKITDKRVAVSRDTSSRYHDGGHKYINPAQSVKYPA